MFSVLLNKSRLFAVSLCFLLPSISAQAAPLETVPRVDPGAYTGLWYEYASIPAFFQRGCTNTTAKYSLKKDGSIRVENNCIAKGKRKNIVGSATPQDTTGAKLSVKFRILGLFNASGDYWVLGLGPRDANGQYSWAVVGEKKRKFGWVLSRKPGLAKSEVAKARAILRKSGYDLDAFKKTRQAW